MVMAFTTWQEMSTSGVLTGMSIITMNTVPRNLNFQKGLSKVFIGFYEEVAGRASKKIFAVQNGIAITQALPMVLMGFDARKTL